MSTGPRLPHQTGDDDALLNAVAKALEKHAQISKMAARHLRKNSHPLPPASSMSTFVISGALNKQIAAHLGISEKTVKTHRGRVMQKLGIESVAKLVRLSIDAGIEPEEM